MFDNVKRIAAYCSCGHKHTLMTEECIVDINAAEVLKDYIQKNSYKTPAVVCDENSEIFTPLAYGKKITVPAGAHATEIQTEYVESQMKLINPDVLIACGSGSVHDITRYCACKNSIPFISYPTAASVDGFVSGVAAMTWHGQKLTFPSVSPIAVFANPDVFCTAPSRLTASGAGDVIGKYVSLFDWKVGQIFTNEYLCTEIFNLEMEAVNEVVDTILNRDKFSIIEYTTKIMNALLLSGLVIQLTGNSRPASGAEHHMSHLWEMRCINDVNDGLHGEQVAVGCVEATKRYKEYLKNGIDFDSIAKINLSRVFDKSELETVFGRLTDGIIAENLPDGTLSSSSLSKIEISDKNKISARIADAASELPSPDKIKQILNLAGAPVSTSEIGLDPSVEFVDRSFRYCPYVRNRLTLAKIISASEK